VILVHEATHAAGGGELAAYTAETNFVLESKDKQVRSLVRKDFVSNGKVDVEAIKAFVKTAYQGWYTRDPVSNTRQMTTTGSSLITAQKRASDGGTSKNKILRERSFS